MKNSTSLIFILIAGGLFYTFLTPQYDRTKSLREELGIYQDALANVSAIESTRNDLSLKLIDIPTVEIDRLSKILPDDVDTVRLAMDLDTIASQYGITINRIEVDSESDNNTAIVDDTSGMPYNKVALSFTFISNYQNFRQFLNGVERSVRITDIRSVSFRSTESGLYEFRVVIETYWLK